VFGRGAEEALALAMAGIPFEVVPGVSSATAAPALAGIPVTHRGTASAFLVVSGHALEAFDAGIRAVHPNGVSLVVLMGLTDRESLAARLMAQGWKPETPSAIVCAASTEAEWTWTGPLEHLGTAQPPDGLAGVLVVGGVVRISDVIARRSSDGGAAASTPAEAGSGGVPSEVSYGRNR